MSAVPPAAPAPPVAPPPPPASAAPPPASRLSKSTIIAVVGVGLAVLSLGAVGATQLLGPAPHEGGGEQHTACCSPPEPGATADPQAGPTSVPTPSGTLTPTPVETGGPLPVPPPQPDPTASPSAPQPEPTSGPGPAPGPVTGEVVIADGPVTIPLGGTWQGELVGDGSQAQFADGQGHFMWVGVFHADPATTATAVIARNLDVLVSAENFTGLEVGEPTQIQSYGAMVSHAYVPYQGLWTDPQGSIEIFGLLDVAVRGDGTVLAMTLETTPPPDESYAGGAFEPLDVGALDSFAGVS